MFHPMPAADRRRGKNPAACRRRAWASPMNLIATHDYTPGGLDAALDFVKRTRSELRALRLVRAWKDRLQIIDVNKDCFEIRGLGYADADAVPVLRQVNAAFNPETLHTPI